jgi:murein DD-endopeptidase MepM/ murein hydrolase activator NlpD
MKDKLLIFYAACIICGIFGISLFAAGGKVYIVEGQDNGGLSSIEDALLVDSLEMSSEELREAIQNGDGEIIYDDDFFSSAQPAPEQTSSHSVENTHNSKTENSSFLKGRAFLDTLKKEDQRWHVSSYKIVKGDSLWKIAEKFDTDHTYIIQYNNIKSPDRVQPGKKIMVPNRKGMYYTVKQGDTLSEISLKNKVALSSLKSENGNSDTIKIGQRLFLPDAEKKVIKQRTVLSKPQVMLASTGTNYSKERIATAVVSSTPKGVKTTKRKARFIRPVQGAITSAFGMRVHPITGVKQFHNGIDIRCVKGTPVKASASGVVIFAGWKGGYGKLVVIRHSNNYISIYGHNSAFKVKKGDRVKQGDIIALSGNTGLSTGPHLHFEIRKYDTPLNPQRML